MFYNGLSNTTKSILDATTRGFIFSKIAKVATTLLEDMGTTSYNWHLDRATTKAMGLYELDDVNALKAEMATLTENKLMVLGKP